MTSTSSLKEFPLPNFTFIDNAEKLRDTLPHLLTATVIGFDTETTGLDPHRDSLRLLQLATTEHTYVFDANEINVADLVPVFASNAVFIGHNLKFDLQFLMSAGITIPSGAQLFDTLLADQLLRGNDIPRSLADVIQEYLRVLLDKSVQKEPWDGPFSQLQIEYAVRDAAILLLLREKMIVKLAELDLITVAELEHSALPAITVMQHNGVPFDKNAWLALATISTKKVADVTKELNEMAGKIINWNSPAQLKKLLNERGIVLQSTAEEVLKQHSDDLLVAKVLEHRQHGKKCSTYGEEFLKHVNAVTNRIHPDWKQIGAASGRMACAKPNLQNIPRETEYRACIHPGLGTVLVKADYSQIELRIAAELTQDKTMMGAFERGEDIHALTAKLILGKDSPSKADRQAAKAINFGLLYGMGAKMLRQYAANNYSVTLTPEEARRFWERFHTTYKGIAQWHWKQRDGIETVTTNSGRKRFNVDRYTEKLNTPVQGTGADGLKRALALLHESRATHPAAKIILAIHDEIVVECDAQDAEDVKQWFEVCMVRGMQEFVKQVPVLVEVTIINDWGGSNDIKNTQITS